MKMKMFSTLVAALCCTTGSGLHADAAPSSKAQSDSAVQQPRSDDTAGARGKSGGNAGEADDGEAALQLYCIGLLDPRKAVRNRRGFSPVDCAVYFANLAAEQTNTSTGTPHNKGDGADGADGAGFAGGVGGRGGRGGVGAGGGQGGAGGAGIFGGGTGGRGGAGGSSN